MPKSTSNKTTIGLVIIFITCLSILCTVNPDPILAVYKFGYIKYVRLTKSAFTSRFNDAQLNLAIEHAKSQDWVKKQIQSDLASFKDGFSDRQLRTWFSSFQHPAKNKLVMFTVKNNTVTVEAQDDLKHSRGYKTITDVITILSNKQKLPDCTFIVSLDDYLSYIPKDAKPAPILTFAKDTTVAIEKDTILVPDWMNIRYWDVLRGRIAAANFLYPWDRKIANIHWRGGTTDSMLHRKKLLDLTSKLHFLDVGMTEGHNAVPFLDPEKSVKYKYQIALDGSRCTWERIIWQMSSNSILIKPDSPQKQWFYGGLKAYENYVPIPKIDEINVVTLYEWLRENDLKVKDISKAANKFSRENFKTVDFFAYYAVLLEEYSKLYHE